MRRSTWHYEQGRAPDRHIVEFETGAYRIVQEALTNAVKHGGATHPTVEVNEDSNHVTVGVGDDGSGFDLTASTTGFGLAGMRKRAELLGGEMSVRSALGEWTTITWCCPSCAERRSPIRGRPPRWRPAGIRLLSR